MMAGTLLDQLRETDRRAYLATLFAPEPVREKVAAIHLLADDLGSIAHKVKEPVAGEIRLQWWRDVFGGERKGEARSVPVAAAVIDLIAEHPDFAERFNAMADARVFDLYADRMPDKDALEAYFGETRSVVFLMCARACGCPLDRSLADAAGHAGCAVGYLQSALSLERDNTRGRALVTSAMVAAIGSSVDAGSSFKEDDLTNLRGILLSSAKDHHVKARAALASLPKEGRSAFLPLAGFGSRCKVAGQDPEGTRRSMREPGPRDVARMAYRALRGW